MLITDQLPGLRTISPLSLKLPKLFSKLKVNYRRRTMSDAWLSHIGRRGKVSGAARRRTVAGGGRRAKIKPEEKDIFRSYYDIGIDVADKAVDIIMAPTEAEEEDVEEQFARLITPEEVVEDLEEAFNFGEEPKGKVVFRSPNQKAIELLTTPIKVVRRFLTGKDMEPIKDYLIDLRDNTRIGQDLRKLRIKMNDRLEEGPNVFRNKSIELVDEDLKEIDEQRKRLEARKERQEDAFVRKLN